MPALCSDELPTPDCTPVEVRLLGEDLIAFRDTEGRVGLVDSCCPHRGSGMFYGRNEESGLRCVYHGWKFDYTGQCVDMPSEPPTSVFKDKLKIPAYPTHESGGMIFTYMGPKDKIPGFRDFGTEGLPRERWSVQKTLEPVTWMQWAEGRMDTTHNSWLHYWKGQTQLEDDGSDAPGVYNSNRGMDIFWGYDRAPDIRVKETWHGFRATGLRKTPKGNIHSRSYVFVFPNIMGFGAGSFIVPIDDDVCWDYRFATVHDEMWNSVVHPSSGPSPGRPFTTDGPEPTLANRFLIDRDLQKDGTIFSGIKDFHAQDIMARQTSYTDRTKEHLGTLDRKIILVRRMLITAAKNLEKGIEPPCLDPSLPYDRVGSLSKVLEPGEDWSIAGSENDPIWERWEKEKTQVAIPVEVTGRGRSGIR
jgi:nitrite reductase/ring-hydroxylating ferredoxin subunit